MVPLQVLIVEDSEDDALLLVDQLQRGGYNTVFERVETPQAMTKALSKPWDLVLSDHSMPKFSAPDALSVLKENNPDIPFVIVSGHMGSDEALAALQSGACDFIRKDKLERLLPVINRELKSSGARRHRVIASQEIDTFRSILDSMADIVWITDDDLNIKYINKAVTALLGYSVKEACAKGLEGLLGHDARVQLNDALKGDPDFGGTWRQRDFAPAGNGADGQGRPDGDGRSPVE